MRRSAEARLYMNTWASGFTCASLVQALITTSQQDHEPVRCPPGDIFTYPRQVVDWNAAPTLIESLHAKRITRLQPDTQSTHPLPQWTLLGCGALGGVFASLLTQSGQSTRVLLRERHRATLHPGIDFTSLEGNTQLINIERGFVDQPGQIQRLLVMTKAGQSSRR